MEFHHTPKLWHGWREFLREYLIVVVGVLTAAAVGLAVDWLHRREEVTEARRALRAEIAENAQLAVILIEEEHCLGVMENYAIDVGNGLREPFATSAAKTPPVGIPAPVTSTWDVVKAGAASRMPFEERVAYSRFYDHLASDLMNSSDDVHALQRLIGHFGKAALTPDDRRRIIEDAVQARLVGTVRAHDARLRLEAAKAMGIAPPPLAAAQRADLATVCGLVGVKPNLAL
jgi:hypothetical protein